MTRARIHTFDPNPGYLLYQATAQELAALIQEVQDIAGSGGQGWPTAHSVLVGSIDREYHLTQSRTAIFDLVEPLAREYTEAFNYQSKIDRLGILPPGTPTPLGLGGLWVNFQQKGEFNPVHQHDGIFSFVIWLQIPYTREQEQATGPGQGPDYKSNGDFHFHFTDTLGSIRSHHMLIDRTYNMTICLFPSELHHVVYPYYSTDELRITVSGNLHLAL
jgi:hypothetical protein